MAADEIDDPVMRPAKAIARQDRVGLGGEVAIGEEQQLDPLPELVLARTAAGAARDFMSDILTYLATLLTIWASSGYKVPGIWAGFVSDRAGRDLGCEETSMSIVPFDDRDGFIWYDGQLVPWREAKLHVLTHALHYASCVFEGERVYGGSVFQLDEHNERLINSARILGFEVPAAWTSSTAATQRGHRLKQHRRRLCPADRLARRRADGRRGAGDQNPPGDRGLGMAGLFLARGARQGHPHEMGEMGAPGAAYRADPGQGGRALHDLHDVEARRRGGGL